MLDLNVQDQGNQFVVWMLETPAAGAWTFKSKQKPLFWKFDYFPVL